MDLSAYRNSARTKERVTDLLGLLPANLENALDVGARDGLISKLLAEHFSSVTALDLEKPSIDHERIQCVKGDIKALDFHDGSFDLVVCTEVLEHIPTAMLSTACNELRRVSNRFLLIGVPYQQDTRVGRTTCRACGERNPPWGHVNSFDESYLRRLFPACHVAKKSWVGTAEAGTNFISCLLMDMAGNPYGTYSQLEPCVACGKALQRPPGRNLLEQVLTKAATYARYAQKPFSPKRGPYWIHLLLEKQTV